MPNQKDLDTTIRFSAIQPNMYSAGPGVRTEIFFYGCTLHCDGCINQWVQEQGLYREEKVSDIVDELIAYGNRNISISGGEPLDQKEGLLSLLNILKQTIINNHNTNILLYTGHNIEEIDRKLRIDITNLTNYRVYGPFEQQLAYKKIEDSFVGSSNQKVLFTINSRWSELVNINEFGYIDDSEIIRIYDLLLKYEGE